MIKSFLIFFYIFSLLTQLPVQAAPKNKETYEYLDLFGQIFDRVRSSYVEEVTDEELIEKAIDGMLTGLDPLRLHERRSMGRDADGYPRKIWRPWY